MWAAVINSILGIGKGVIDSNASNYASTTGRIQGSVDYQRSKEVALYDLYRSQLSTMLIIIGIGIVFLTVLYFINKRNG